MHDRAHSFGDSVFIADECELGSGVQIGHASCIGHPTPHASGLTRVGDNVTIGAFCVLERAAQVDDGVTLDHYCRIGAGARVGENSKILYGVQVFNNASIGPNCIVGGNLSERTTLEHNVTFQGAIAHSHRDPTLDWDTTDEPSPVVRAGSVVGVDALLIGGIVIGPRSYVAAREVVRCDVPPETVLLNGELRPLAHWRHFIKVRDA